MNGAINLLNFKTNPQKYRGNRFINIKNGVNLPPDFATLLRADDSTQMNQNEFDAILDFAFKDLVTRCMSHPATNNIESCDILDIPFTKLLDWMKNSTNRVAVFYMYFPKRLHMIYLIKTRTVQVVSDIDIVHVRIDYLPIDHEPTTNGPILDAYISKIKKMVTLAMLVIFGRNTTKEAVNSFMDVYSTLLSQTSHNYKSTQPIKLALYCTEVLGRYLRIPDGLNPDEYKTRYFDKNATSIVEYFSPD